MQSTAMQKNKEAARKDAQALAEQKKKEVVAKEAVEKEQAKKEHPDTKKVEESTSQHRDEREILGKEGGGEKGKSMPFTLKKHGKEQAIGK